ncbi:MAG: L-arabinose isomerase [Sphaerochaetaceae bacterium]
MNPTVPYEFWFLTGSQHLYGEAALKQVAADSQKITDALNASKTLPYRLVNKPVLTLSTEIRSMMEQAVSAGQCAGVICWMHTFSPAKMWIAGLSVLNKPLLQLNTQFNETIPYDTMDMDFMNLNQSAHGDREFGFITARMDLPRKVIVGHWSHLSTQKRIADWMRSASAFADSTNLVIARFGDNMRDVAVTDGDKVEAMVKLGWSVPYYGVGDLVAYIKQVSERDVDVLMEEYRHTYRFVHSVSKEVFMRQVRGQARIEIALKAFLADNGAHAFCTNFQDLHGMDQLPGLAAQRLMAEGYGFAGEGDWKTAAMVRALKVMGSTLDGGTSFMEDYTYNLAENDMYDLGAHMLELCPSIAAIQPTLEVHPLGIGDREDPARLVFDGRPGPAICTALVDFGNRFRIVLNEVETVASPHPFAKLPVARVLWKPLPDLTTAAEAWILAGGGHHTAYSDCLKADHIRDFAEMAGIEFVSIGKGTTIPAFRNELRWNAGYWDNRRR